MADAPRPKTIIEPLDVSRHDRSAFSCGIDQVDNFFRKTANKLSKADNLRVFVMTQEDGAIIGFYAINAHSVDYQDLPEKYARTRPGHGSIPAVYISMIGRDRRFSGSGYGGDLLADCLKRIASISRELGIAVVMLDVLNCGDEVRTARRVALYRGYGFQSLSSADSRMYLPVSTLRALQE